MYMSGWLDNISKKILRIVFELIQNMKNYHKFDCNLKLHFN